MFVLKKRKYTWLDMFRIPFSCAPVSTIVVTLQKVITMLVNVLQVVVVAEFVDSAVAAVMNRTFDRSALTWFIILMLMVSWKRVSYNIGRLFTKHIVIKGNEQFLNECTEKRSRLRYCLLENPDTEELINRITDKLERNISEMLQRFLNFFVIYIPRIAGVLIIIGMHVWWLAIVVTVMTVPLIAVSLRGGKKIYKANETAAVYERRHHYFFDLLTGREAVEERSLFGYSSFVNQQWHNQYDAARKINFKAEAMFTASINAGSILTSVLSSAIVIIMIPLTASGEITVGLFVSLSTAVYDLVNLMGWEMSKAVSQIAKFREYMRDLTQFAALPERQTGMEAADTEDAGIIEFKELEFKHVTFHYPGAETNILQDFSMKIERGQHYAVVGENGAGKSTLIKLLTGLYTDYEGEILLNGRELRSYSPKEWKKVFSGVYQDFARYYISVEDNIQIGNIGTIHEMESKKRMHLLAQKLGIHEAITSLRHRYATRLGKLDADSVDLSGGQWQKVAMARALMNEAPLLILDEPTAALDPISESQLYELFGEISKDRTTIFISHRLGSTKLANHIFVIGDGCIQEQGSHEELLQRGGSYAEMYKAQQSWYVTSEGGA
ncbi:MAG: ABC transporter ATP-binding protein [Lachnospiraceae bacterium]|nr:ABC transporter ATP-binding protein [Lachnospiraceae bacterium]